MVNYIDMYAEILNRLILDVVEHGCIITPTVADIWMRIPTCMLTPYNDLTIYENILTIQPTRLDERVAITITNADGISVMHTYLWQEDEIEPLVYQLLEECPKNYLISDDTVATMRADLAKLNSTALLRTIRAIIEKYIFRPRTGDTNE